MLSQAATDILNRYLEQTPEPSSMVTTLPDIDCILKLRALVSNLGGVTDEGARLTLQEWTKTRLHERRKNLNIKGPGLDQIFKEMVVREVTTTLASSGSLKLVPVDPTSPAAATPPSSTTMTMTSTHRPATLIVYQPSIHPAAATPIKNYTLMYRVQLVSELQELATDNARWHQLYRFLSRDADASEYRAFVLWESAMQEQKSKAPKPTTNVKTSRNPLVRFLEDQFAIRQTLHRSKLLKDRASQLVKEATSRLVKEGARQETAVQLLKDAAAQLIKEGASKKRAFQLLEEAASQRVKEGALLQGPARITAPIVAQTSSYSTNGDTLHSSASQGDDVLEG
ncbi:MAG: hypothetical protein Q9186_000600 [Xanthomendoza sp. 1 TL-2023]